MLVAGVDSSTQNTKIVLCDAATGEVVAAASAPHPDGTSCPPGAWQEALQKAGDGLLSRAAAVSVAGQQHGMVALDDGGEVVRDALLWNDTRSAPQAGALVAELGGREAWAHATGSVPTASFTVTKLRWLAENEPDNAGRTAAVLLPHDWLTWKLGASGYTTDRGDASGTGYFSHRAGGEWLPEHVKAAFGRELELPRIAGPGEAVGETSWGAVLGAGTGDNMAAALGLGLRPGDVVVSLGTSGTAFMVGDAPTADASGAVAGFADATGRYLPLVCTLNAARVLTATAAMIGATLEELSELALRAEPGAGGLTLLPYLDGERTPDRPTASGVLSGLTTRNAGRENLARAGVEGMLASLAEAADRLGAEPSRIVLIGGAAVSEAVRKIAPEVFGVPVCVPRPAEYVALGAARQAAWALTGTLPDWPEAPSETFTGESRPIIRRQHVELRDATLSWNEE
ncbi:xylulokinase [Actinocorallia longicatena]|uniref:Xylulose kinase n=1 Tax=Actinocorallia longicatena TaxID=111803 RepID=A0ABP6Q7N4_9ACTN